MSVALLVGLLTGLVGLASTIFAYFISPQRAKDKIRKQIDEIDRQLLELEKKRDETLVKDDSDSGSVILDAILRLRQNKADLLKRQS